MSVKTTYTTTEYATKTVTTTTFEGLHKLLVDNPDKVFQLLLNITPIDFLEWLQYLHVKYSRVPLDYPLLNTPIVCVECGKVQITVFCEPSPDTPSISLDFMDTGECYTFDKFCKESGLSTAKAFLREIKKKR